VSENRREQILAAAVELVHEHGIEGLHARTIAARIGVNHAAIHYYFPKRDNLLLAMCEFISARFTQDRAKALEGSDRMKGHLQQARAYCAEDSVFLTNWLALYQVARDDQAVRAELVRFLREWIFTIGLEIRKVKNPGPLHDPEILVATCLGVMICAQTLGEEFDYRSKFKSILKELN
jgi:AcrR family transcriptional regulator